MNQNEPILIVEDSDEDFYATARVLGRFGSFPLQRCTQGTEVRPHLEKNSSTSAPRLILLDLNLPGKRDGRAVLADLKSDIHYRHIPVVIMTTSSNPRDVRECFDHGAAGYMVKPVNLDRFVESIEALVKYWFDVMTLPPRWELHP
jgi:CheY-like chemotaxis protein